MINDNNSKKEDNIPDPFDFTNFTRSKDKNNKEQVEITKKEKDMTRLSSRSYQSTEEFKLKRLESEESEWGAFEDMLDLEPDNDNNTAVHGTKKMFWKMVSPALAARWLLRNHPDNRKPRPRDEQKYTDMMKAGQWCESPQTISFDINGDLIDGQHRLTSIVKSGKTVLVPIVTGIAPEALANLDNLAARTMADAVRIDGVDWITKNMVGAAEFAMTAPKSKMADQSPKDMVEFVNFHRNAIEFVNNEMSGHTPKISTATVKALLIHAYYNIDQNRLKRIIHYLKTGLTLGYGDEQPIIKLRDYLMNKTGESKVVVYGKGQDALKYYKENKPVKRLVVIGEDILELPAYKKADTA